MSLHPNRKLCLYMETIPKSTSKLKNLEDLDLSSNNISGTTELNNLLGPSKLQKLDLSNNCLQSHT